MRWAAVVSDDRDTIVALPDGPLVIIWDDVREAEEFYVNPALNRTSGRRFATAQLFVEKKADVACTVDQGFCTRSYGEARTAGLRFLLVKPGTRLSEIKAQPEEYRRQIQPELDRVFLAIPQAMPEAQSAAASSTTNPPAGK